MKVYLERCCYTCDYFLEGYTNRCYDCVQNNWSEYKNGGIKDKNERID